MLDPQNTKIAMEGKARMPGSGMSLPSSLQRMTVMTAAETERYEFWLETGEEPQTGDESGALEFWRTTRQIPNPNITSYCIAHRCTFADVAADGGMQTYWAWNYAQRREFLSERGLDETAAFDDELANQFRVWLRLHALEINQ